MRPAPLMALGLALGLVSQAPGQTRDWVVIPPRDGGFSLAMPGRPVEDRSEQGVPGGKVVTTSYTLGPSVGGLVIAHERFPPASDPAAVLDEMEGPLTNPALANRRLVSKKPLEVGGVKGREIVQEISGSPQGIIKARIQVYAYKNHRLMILARSFPGRPLGPEVDLVLKSIRFDGKPAVVPSSSSVTATLPRPSRRKSMGKVPRDDATPEAALRTFVMAMEAADEPTLREVALPNPDLDWLLGGEPPPDRGMRELRARIQRLRSGDSVRLAGDAPHVIRPSEVGNDRAALMMDGLAGYARLRKVNGRWKVDAGPLIEGRKAAAASRSPA